MKVNQLAAWCWFASVLATAAAVHGQTVVIDFETEDDLVTPLVNGQGISTPPEFGVLVEISSSGSGHLGPAIFDSTMGGPNAGGPDPDLLVGLGNLLILQTGSSPAQTVPGIFDTPNDHAGGGTIFFDFVNPVAPLAVDLADINSGPQDVTITLTDDAGLTRVFEVPSQWTRAINVGGPNGYDTLDFTTLDPQTGEGGATATASEDAGFNPLSVVQAAFAFSGSGAMDNLTIRIGCVGPEDCFDNIVCTDDICNPDGTCSNPPSARGTPCEKTGNLCTLEECDGAGACVMAGVVKCPIPIVQMVCDGGQACDPATGLCVDQPDAPAGTECDLDDSLCTPDVCDGMGGCLPGAAVTCEPGESLCDGGESCDPQTGECVEGPDAPAGTDCEFDGDLCTLEQCDGSGACVESGTVTCAPAEPPCEGGQACDPKSGACFDQPDAPPDTPCESDGDLCTIEACDGSGACQSVDTVTCDAPAGPCDGGQTCDPLTGACVDEPDAPAGTACDSDGDLCTIEECDGSGACVAMGSVTCDPAAPPCEGGQTCDPLTGSCVDQPDAPAGTACDSDGDLCTTEECDGSGACVAMGTVTCDPAAPPCEGGQTCDPLTGSCVDQPDAPAGTACDNDGDLCTIEQCDGSGGCVPMGKVTCDPPVSPCDGGQTCDPLTGSCVDQPDPPAGTECATDEDLCTLQQCDGSGACVAAGTVQCDPAVPPCEGGQVCEPDTGQCVDQPDAPAGTDCDPDGNLCTLEACDGSGSCVSTGNVTCAAPVPPCEGGQTCDPQTGACMDQLDAPVGTMCQLDEDLCTIEFCNGTGACVSGGNVTCQGPTSPCDGGQFCDSDTGLCVNNPDAPLGTDCESDGDSCTVELCVENGQCVVAGSTCGSCCLPDGSCLDGTTPTECQALGGMGFKGAGSVCLGDHDGDGVDDQCDELLEEPPIPALSGGWRVVAILALAGAVIVRTRSRGRAGSARA